MREISRPSREGREARGSKGKRGVVWIEARETASRGRERRSSGGWRLSGFSLSHSSRRMGGKMCPSKGGDQLGGMASIAGCLVPSASRPFPALLPGTLGTSGPQGADRKRSGTLEVTDRGLVSVRYLWQQGRQASRTFYPSPDALIHIKTTSETSHVSSLLYRFCLVVLDKPGGYHHQTSLRDTAREYKPICRCWPVERGPNGPIIRSKENGWSLLLVIDFSAFPFASLADFEAI
jgi:hypothetical protein